MSDTAISRARQWCDAWNSRDIVRIFALYADDCVMASPKIVAAGIDPRGRVAGKAALRAYWQAALERQPDLHFTMLAAYTAPDSLVIGYRNQAGLEVCEYLRYGPDGLIVQAAAHHRVSDG